jgi:hypothetical protein
VGGDPLDDLTRPVLQHPDVQAARPDDGDDGAVAGRVDGQVAVAAPRDRLAEGPALGGERGPAGHGQGDGGQRGDLGGLDVGDVVRDHQPVAGRDQAAADPGDVSPDLLELRPDEFLDRSPALAQGRHQPTPPGAT